MILLPVKEIEANTGQIKGLPANPRTISESAMRKLKASIVEDPEMLELREVLVYPHKGKYVCIGGNQRFRACCELGYEEIPCKIIPKEMPIPKLKAILAKDNVSHGEWDFDALEDCWDEALLQSWGVYDDDWDDDDELFADDSGDEIEETEPNLKGSDGTSSSTSQTKTEDDAPTFADMLLDDRIFNSNNEYEIPTLRKDMMALSGLVVPFAPWGADSRLRTDVQTYHFYVDDYRFEAIWKDPSKLVNSGCSVIVEPNLSLYETTPVAYGLHMIYKKRWISRWLQEKGIRVYVDLNVASKFYEYNQIGIPKGYNAFCTRGYADRLVYTKMELDIARQISGVETPNMLVYGGGKAVKQFCQENGLIYVESFINGERKEALKNK